MSKFDLFHVQTGLSFHHKKYPKLTRRALSTNNVNHISLFSHTHTHIIHAKREELLLLLTCCSSFVITHI
jgi:hypothetical protein